MDLKKETQQRQEFCDILYELAKSQKSLEDSYNRSTMYRRIEKLYDAESEDKRFRHFYSDIFSVLTAIKQSPDLGDINILGENLSWIRRGYKSQNTADDGKRVIDVSDSIKKLFDHVSLVIAQIAYSEGADRKISGEESIENLQGQINALRGELQEAQKIVNDYSDTKEKIDKVEEKLDSSQKEYITILGIFAAVVLAFTGGLAFSTSVLNNIAQVSVYRTVIVALLIGLVLINILFGLFYYINSLVDKKKRILPLIISNAVIVVAIIVTLIAWTNGWVENRDSRMANQQTITEFEDTVFPK